MKHKILLGLTTCLNSEWKNKIKEIDKFGIKELALFPTMLKIDQRKELYNLLEKTNLKEIPHVHLRDDMEEWEVEFLIGKYKANLFNIHPSESGYNYVIKSKYKNKIFVENQAKLNETFFNVLNNCGGLCIDFSHWEDKGEIQKNEGYEKMEELIKKYKIGCCHISAISENILEEYNYEINKIIFCHDLHIMNDLNQLNYIKKYLKYLPEYVSIELENSFEEQLEVKEYLEKIINI